jgi:hypothetical protein
LGKGLPECLSYRQPKRQKHLKRRARGYEAGKKIKGRKRYIATDTIGLMLFVTVHAASIQDRDGAVGFIKAIRHRLP